VAHVKLPPPPGPWICAPAAEPKTRIETAAKKLSLDGNILVIPQNLLTPWGWQALRV
jgi:hypothetical protein